jgi:hypothetical protein
MPTSAISCRVRRYVAAFHEDPLVRAVTIRDWMSFDRSRRGSGNRRQAPVPRYPLLGAPPGRPAPTVTPLAGTHHPPSRLFKTPGHPPRQRLRRVGLVAASSADYAGSRHVRRAWRDASASRAPCCRRKHAHRTVQHGLADDEAKAGIALARPLALLAGPGFKPERSPRYRLSRMAAIARGHQDATCQRLGDRSGPFAVAAVPDWPLTCAAIRHVAGIVSGPLVDRHDQITMPLRCVPGTGSFGTSPTNPAMSGFRRSGSPPMSRTVPARPRRSAARRDPARASARARFRTLSPGFP